MSHKSDDIDTEDDRRDERNSIRDRLEQLVDRARAGFDEGVVDVLSWLLDTETRTRVYVHLRQNDWSTSENVAEGTGLQPASVRNTLDELVEQNAVERREHSGGGAEYEYDAVPPSDLLGGAVDPVRDSLESAVPDKEGEESARIEIDSGSSVEAEAGEAEVDAETDVEGEAELDEEGASVEGKGSGELDAETSDSEAEVEGSVDAEVGTDGIDIDVDADVETPAEDGADESPESSNDGRTDDDAEKS
ncbi:ArsR family transcriptional regulator [Halapricum desulfuricans]|uniref:Putative transcriptional regulator n=1 Tax=Halapricum desulfuricans TaxID=2841257 RepID=A0A897NUK6_9EURY|nr:ArsR family transcriptional regulator [Halapricum desulfuricans]QSG14493.1 putative transcriptional regulator [Halapricum desulfuricans]